MLWGPLVEGDEGWYICQKCLVIVLYDLPLFLAFHKRKLSTWQIKAMLYFDA